MTNAGPRVGVLGSTTVEVDGVPIELGSLKQRALLATLALAGGHPVSVDRISEALWGDRPPAGVITTLHGYVAALRRILEPRRAPRSAASVLVTTPAGYSLRLPANGVDATDFAAVTAAAARVLDRIPDHLRPTSSPADRAPLVETFERLEAALDTWRGRPYADLPEYPAAESERQRLTEMQLTARTTQIVIGLALGDHTWAIGVLDTLIAQHPLREQLWALRAVGLARAGRQAESLDSLQDLRTLLVDELGIDPSPAVRHVQSAILRQEEGVLAPSPGTPDADERSDSTEAVGGPRPPWPLIGRDREMACLTGALDRVRQGCAEFAELIGAPGIGKSRLLQELSSHAVGIGFRRVEGRCSAETGAPALWPLRQVLAAITGSGELGQLGLDSPSSWTDLARPSAQFELGEAFARILGSACADTPLVMVVEDVQWADPLTLRVLRHCTERCRDLRLMICISHRPAPESPLLRGLSLALSRADAIRLDLPGLDAEETTRLLERIAEVRPDLAASRQLRKQISGAPDGRDFGIVDGPGTLSVVISTSGRTTAVASISGTDLAETAHRSWIGQQQYQVAV